MNQTQWRIPMPTIATRNASSHIRQTRLFLEEQDMRQAKFERNWKIRFGICLLATVFAGSFIFLSVITL